MEHIIDFAVGLDIRLMYLLNVSLHNPVFNWMMPIFDNDHAWRLPLLLAWMVLMIFGNRRTRLVGLGALVLLLITDPVSSRLIKPLAGRIRPCNILSGLNMWKDGAWIVLPDPVIEIYRSSYSLPSSHAANTAAQALWWGWAYPKTRWVWWGLAVIIGYSRVYDGMHWPGDVVMGWIVGGAAFGLVWLVSVRWVKNIDSGRVVNPARRVV